jgi:hypothetical protein
MTLFAEVLAREGACLAGVTDGSMLVNWRCGVVKELMTPHSPYALALRRTNDLCRRAEFLDQWRELIAETVHRVQLTGASGDTRCSSERSPTVLVDAQKTAVLILAAIHGGSILSQLAQDSRPLNAALDLALVPLITAVGNGAS